MQQKWVLAGIVVVLAGLVAGGYSFVEHTRESAARVN